MNGFLAALQFLTILRARKEADAGAQQLASSTIYFPLVGAFLGIALIVLNKFLSAVFIEPLLSLILVAALIILTGALHLDGLADTFDALASGKTKEDKLTIMRDSHKGTFGVLSIVIDILFKVSAIASLSGGARNFGIFLMACTSRYNMSLAIISFPYARNEGKAKVFFENKNPGTFLKSTLLMLILTAL